MDEGIEQKNNWLDVNAPFFKKENRTIISRQSNEFKTSSELKRSYLTNEDNKIKIVIDDDPFVLKTIKNTCNDIVLLKDTALID